MTNGTKIIGLTGNIATGKSVVRRMLANSGALGIDADEITHRMLYPENPVYHAIKDTFGEEIISADGQISRSKLGEIVFNDPDKLRQLEKLIHPGVTEAIKKRIQLATAPMIVIEAIKLLESDVKGLCDSIWVTHASAAHQIKRLMQARNMDERQARERIAAQPPQEEKLARADVVIHTEGDFKRTWQEVQESLNDTIHVNINLTAMHFNIIKGWTAQSAGSLTTDQLEKFWRQSASEHPEKLYLHLGTKMMVLLSHENRLKSMIAWDNRNFSALLDQVIPKSAIQGQAPNILEAFMDHASQKQCEVLFLPDRFISEGGIQPENYGFEIYSACDLAYPAWQESAARFVKDHEDKIWIKILAQPVEVQEK